MKLVCLILISIIIIPTIRAQEGTVWGPANGYEIAYVHTAIIDLDGTEILKEENLPVTDFRVLTIHGGGYTYLYEGFGEKGFNGDVVFSMQDQNDPLSYFPTVSFPLLIPLVFQSTDNWPTTFVENYKNKDSIIDFSNDVSPFVNTKPILEEDILSFQVSGIVDLINSSRILSAPESLPSISHPRLTGDFGFGVFQSTLEFNINTGVLFKFEVNYDSRNYIIPNSQAVHHLIIYQKIEFVMLIPPGIIIENLIELELSLLIFFVFTLLLIRKQRF